MRRTYSKKEVGRYVAQAELASKASDPGRLAEAMEVLLTDDRWMDYVDPADRREYQWQSFREFVERRLHTTPEALAGYLAAFKSLRERVENAERGHAIKIAAMVVEASKAPRSGHRGRTAGSSASTSDYSSAAERMRRLMRERPDLAERVERGELRIETAWIQAGWRPPHAHVPLEIGAFAWYGVRTFGRDELLAAVEEAAAPQRACVICNTLFPDHGKTLTCSIECRMERTRWRKRESARRRSKARKEARDAAH